jgi:predicted glycoside hydrolase/deacetylase ChbG (UPF0249 family)
MKLIIRGDDAGSTFSANIAVEQCVRAGMLRNVSVMACGPAIQDAAVRLASCRDVCVGLHVTLNSEFVVPRYRPVLPPERVPSLVGQDGCFLSAPMDLHQRGFSLDDAVAEVVAQLSRARSLGLKMSYLDEHMGVGWLPGLADRFRELCRAERLVYAPDAAHALPARDEQAEHDRVGEWLSRIELARRSGDDRTWVLITHPMLDDDEARSMHGPLHPPGSVARARHLDRVSLLDPRFANGLRESGVQSVRYDDAC